MWIIIFFIVSVCVNCVVSQDVGDKCTNNDLELEGTCTLVINCEVAIQAIKRKKFNQYKRCGFSGLVEVVCCPQNNMRFGSHDRENTQRISEKECSKIITSSTPVLDLHILGGEEAAVGEFPHQVALGYSIGNDFDFKCGGSVLSPTYVLTAAHCVDTADRITPTIVRAGVIEIGGTEWNDSTDYRIEDIKLHPNYVRKEKYHDLALLRLQRPLQFSYTLNAICLETSSEDPKISLTVTGWGQTSVQRVTNSRILLKTNVTAVPRDKCAESYTLWRKLPVGISQDQLCAGDPEGKRDTCQGDSGGPIVATSANGTNTLVGVTSFGRGCGSAIPGVYTRISSYIDWIERIVWPSQSS